MRSHKTMTSVLSMPLLILFVFLQNGVLADFFTSMDKQIGCFYDKPFDRDLTNKAQVSSSLTIKMCTKACSNMYFKYAGLQDGSSCYCGGSYGRHGPGQCSSVCRGNSSQICGGTTSNTIYDTGYKLPGPPNSLNLVNNGPTSMYINWTSPLSTNGDLIEYQVSAEPNTQSSSSSSQSSRTSPIFLRFSATTKSARLDDLISGTQYKVGVAGVNQEGVGASVTKLFWTEVGKPPIPDSPEVISTNVGTMSVKLTPVEPKNGPITAYQIIVLANSLHRHFQPVEFVNYNRAKEDGLPYWVAAQLRPDQFKDTFVIGDGRLYGGFWNHKLPKDERKKFRVGLSVISTLNGMTKRSYSGEKEFYIQKTIVSDADVTEESASSSALVVGLTVAIVIAAVILTAAIGIFVYLRHSLGTRFRRRRGDTQELAVHSNQCPPAAINVEENGGYLGDGSYINEAMRTAEEYLESLRGKVWIIPKNFIEVSGEVLGQGKFGSVVRSTVSTQGKPVSCNTQVIPRLEDEQIRKNMLRDLDLTIQAGQHPGLVCLLGICEDASTTLVVMEQGEPSLKQFLLDSRALTHHPQYATKHGRISTAKEDVLMEMIAGLASGLSHLEHLGIQHGNICARNIVMSGEIGAKLAGFGMSTWGRNGERPDCTRWQASETLMNKQSNSKSDVWSFGCLLWEVATLGGTPYVAVKTRDLGVRIMRGLRLHQVHGLSDQLYQLMLACWMTDPDERPSAEDLHLMLADLASSGGLEIDFTYNSKIDYEQCLPELELEHQTTAHSTLL